jgi:hypothetical protein
LGRFLGVPIRGTLVAVSSSLLFSIGVCWAGRDDRRHMTIIPKPYQKKSASSVNVAPKNIAKTRPVLSVTINNPSPIEAAKGSSAHAVTLLAIELSSIGASATPFPATTCDSPQTSLQSLQGAGSFLPGCGSSARGAGALSLFASLGASHCTASGFRRALLCAPCATGSATCGLACSPPRTTLCAAGSSFNILKLICHDSPLHSLSIGSGLSRGSPGFPWFLRPLRSLLLLRAL